MRTGASPAISARGLVKHFGTIRAIDGLDLEVPRGSAFGFIGENGAGKTTFIKLLLGICRPSEGCVEVLGQSPDDVRVRRRIGYLPERLSLPPAFSPRRFLESVGRLKGLSAKERHDQIPRVLSRVGLAEEAWDRRTAGFSKGMRQRTGLAAALLGDPELLVLDEPTDGIDPMGRARIREVIREAARGGATIFLNSHLLAETERICDHVAIVSKGRVVRAGPLEALRSEGSHRVRFVEGPDVDEKAQALGFAIDEKARAAGLSGSFCLDGKDPAGLSQALQAALEAGLLVVEVAPRLKDLETVLAEAVAERGAG